MGKNSKIYFVGAGIGSLAAAALMGRPSPGKGPGHVDGFEAICREGWNRSRR